MIRQLCFAALLAGGMAVAAANPFADPMIDEVHSGLRYYLSYDGSSGMEEFGAEAVVAVGLPTKGMVGLVPFRKKADAVAFAASYKMMVAASDRLSFTAVERLEVALMKSLGDVKFTEPSPAFGEIVFATTVCEDLDFSRAEAAE